jgi:hypothetical protein
MDIIILFMFALYVSCDYNYYNHNIYEHNLNEYPSKLKRVYFIIQFGS